MHLQNEIRRMLPNENDYLIGFADMGYLIKNYYPFRYAVVVGAKLDRRIVNEIKNGVTLEYCNLYNEIDARLNGIVEEMSNFLHSRGIDNQFIRANVEEGEPDSEFRKTLRYNYSHKMAATRAGIGWIGKTDLLISERFGPRLQLAGLVTDYPFEEPGIPVNESRCGNCTVCVEACPGQAANGRLWNTGVDRDEFFDAFKCRETCRRRSWAGIRKEADLCGVCVSVCPKGKMHNAGVTRR